MKNSAPPSRVFGHAASLKIRIKFLWFSFFQFDGDMKYLGCVAEKLTLTLSKRHGCNKPDRQVLLLGNIRTWP